MEIKIPGHVDYIITQLNKKGYEAYAVGGCVRDALLGREPEDWDITTSARPEEVKQLFRRTIDTGIEHGTVTVMLDNDGYEVTTYRIDGEYEDGRHPREVAFTSDLLEDLRRRDFTINAMAYSREAGIVDAFEGRRDLDDGVIRCVGAPLDRFTEDALRILRAIRFSAQLGFVIEPETWAAIRAIAPNIAKVSKERIQAELTKLLLSDRPGQITQVFESGISVFISPAFHALPWRELTISHELPKIRYLRWAACLYPAAPEQAVQVLKDLKLDNDTIRKVRTLITWSSCELVPEPAAVRLAMSRMEPEVWDALLMLKHSLSAGSQIAQIDQLKVISQQVRTAGDCLTLADLAVNGQDLLAAGMKPGKPLGEALGFLLEKVLGTPELNQKEKLLSLIKTTSCPEEE